MSCSVQFCVHYHHRRHHQLYGLEPTDPSRLLNMLESSHHSSYANQKFPHISWNLKVPYRLHNNPPASPVLNCMDPSHDFPYYFFVIHFRRVRKSVAKSQYWCLSVRSSACNNTLATARIPVKFHISIYFFFFAKPINEFQVWLISDNNRGNFTRISICFHWSLLWSVLCEIRTKVEETVDALKVTTETDCVVSKSDVWLTVHRNSVWIRKTN